MLGWFADSFRFAWALLYWNIRKSWFRLRRGRIPCPCQSPSDSGRAFETGCDACMHWHRPDRFRRVCPLLVRTPQGLRCSANTANVRPFWGIASLYYGGTLLAIYTVVVVSIFTSLRSIGYPVSIVHVALPPLWHRVGQARDWYYTMRAREAFSAGRTNEGLLYLQNAYDFEPSNYEVGLALAKAYQLGHPARSDAMFERLLKDHPQQNAVTAQHWFRALIARGDFEKVTSLAASQLVGDPRRANAWIRALLVATAQTRDVRPLRELLVNPAPGAAVWRQLLQVELQLREGRAQEVRAALEKPWPANAPAYTVVYRAEKLADLGEPAAALDLLLKLRSRIDDEAYLTVRLHCLARADARQTLHSEFERYLLAPPLTQPRLKMMCAQLIRHPDAALFSRVTQKVTAEAMPLTDETAGGWFSLLCAAGAVGEQEQLHALTLRLRQASETPFSALLMVESFFRNQMADRRATVFLPFLPVPLEVTYALIDRYPGAAQPSTPAAPSGTP